MLPLGQLTFKSSGQGQMTSGEGHTKPSGHMLSEEEPFWQKLPRVQTVGRAVPGRQKKPAGQRSGSIDPSGQ